MSGVTGKAGRLGHSLPFRQSKRIVGTFGSFAQTRPMLEGGGEPPLDPASYQPSYGVTCQARKASGSAFLLEGGNLAKGSPLGSNT